MFKVQSETAEYIYSNLSGTIQWILPLVQLKDSVREVSI